MRGRGDVVVQPECSVHQSSLPKPPNPMVSGANAFLRTWALPLARVPPPPPRSPILGATAEAPKKAEGPKKFEAPKKTEALKKAEDLKKAEAAKKAEPPKAVTGHGGA